MASKKDEKSIKAYMGEDTEFSGTLSFEGAVRIDGKFEGKVVTQDTLIVGELGDLNAEINAGTVICKGKIQGTVVTSEKLEIHSTGRITGNVKIPALYVEVGGVLDGQCDMTGGGKKIIQLVKEDEAGADEPRSSLNGGSRVAGKKD